jgi:hypothetical protein
MLVPALAAAHSGRHHRAHHARTRHHRRHGQAPAANGALTPSGPVSSTSGGAGSTPTAPAGPTTGSTELAGTVQSFNEGILTIALSGGGTVSGRVTEGTEIECKSAGGGDDQGSGEDVGDEGGQDGEEAGDEGGSGQSREGADARMRSDAAGEGSDDGGSSCTTAALVANASIAEAELSVVAGGAVWDHIVVIA